MIRKQLSARARVLAIVTLVLGAVACGQTDPGITAAVKTRFATDDVVKAYNINVDTKNGVVTLSGAVETVAAKERAVQIARQTEGVRDVVDSLTVNPSATVGARVEEQAREAARAAGQAVDRARDAAADAALTTSVKTRLMTDDVVKGLQIDVDSANGVVTLSGMVRTKGERERAIDVANRTEGVTRVVDKLTVR